MAKLSKNLKKDEQLAYLAGILDHCAGVTDGNGAVAIGAEEWIDWLVKTFGGYRETFQAKSGRQITGWFMNDADRKKLLPTLQPWLQRADAQVRISKTITRINK